MMAARLLEPSVTLGALLDGIVEAGRFADCPIQSLTLDSREVGPGALFIARAGNRGHGLDYLEQALAQGAEAVLADGAASDEILEHAGRRVPLFRRPGASRQAGVIAARFYGDPSAQMHLVGVTGTNGKTSVSHFVAQALAADGPCGVIGTLGSGLVGDLNDTGHTTPDPITVQAELARLHTAGARWTVMEVSSHALHQARVAGVRFDTAVFTNLTHDHLDYHGDMAAYAAAKRALFNQPGLRRAVVNADDPVGSDWLAGLAPTLEVCDYGLGAGHGRPPHLQGRGLQLSAAGLELEVKTSLQRGLLHSPLLGRFNAYNLLAALGALLGTGMAFDEALVRLAQVDTVPGRMQRFGGGNGRPLVVVDFAHTPDALEHVLTALAEHCHGDLWCVFGCGGDRDPAKRPLMGRIAEHHADHVVITDDNPRTEDPYAIIEAIQAGMANADAAYVERDRATAIARALDTAAPDDVVLVAGKGHEAYQQVGQRRLPYSDLETVARLLKQEVAHG